MSIDTSYAYEKADDWQGKSVADHAAFAGFGGGVKHFSIWSPSLKKGIHGYIAFVGVGVEAKIGGAKIDAFVKKNKFDEQLFKETLPFLRSFMNARVKNVTSLMNAVGGYSPLTNFKPFSLFDFSTAQVAMGEAAATLVGGAKVEGLTAYSGGEAIFGIPPSVAGALGIGAGAYTALGIIITPLPFSLSTARRFNQEKERERASDPLPRPMGGFAAG